MTEVKRSVFMPEALSKPVPRTAPATEVNRLMLVVCEWARADPLVLSGVGRKAADEWQFLAEFLAFNLLPCFKVLRTHSTRPAGRRPRNANVLRPGFNNGAVLTREEDAWLIRTIDGIRAKNGCAVLEACKQLKTFHRNREFVASRAASTLRRLYHEAYKRKRDNSRQGSFSNALHWVVARAPKPIRR
jgi:hypothetical protein